MEVLIKEPIEPPKKEGSSLAEPFQPIPPNLQELEADCLESAKQVVRNWSFSGRAAEHFGKSHRTSSIQKCHPR